MAGNLIGQGGLFFFLPFAFALLISVFTSTIVAKSPSQDMSADSKTLAVPTTQPFNNFIRLVLTLASCVALVLMIPTGALVTAGFTFNETFLYWFPNFGFSFLLLGGILFIHLWSNKLPLTTQTFFFGVTSICLLILSLYGLLSEPGNNTLSSMHSPDTPSPTSAMDAVLIWRLLVIFGTSLILFLGFDHISLRSTSTKQRILVMLTGGSLIALWCGASLLHVPGQKLAQSTIPYILGAREILGQPGRILIGIAIIFGALGVVNGLLIYTYRTIMQISADLNLPLKTSPLWTQRVIALTATPTIGILMATGLAGETKLETYIYGALLLWLLLAGTRVMISQVARSLIQKNAHESTHPGLNLLLPALYLFAFLFSVINYEDSKSLFKFFILALLAATAAAVGWKFIARLPQHNQITKGDN